MRFTVHIHRQDGSSSAIDFRDYDAAVRFAKQRASTPLVTRTEITSEHRMVWSSITGVEPRQIDEDASDRENWTYLAVVGLCISAGGFIDAL